MCIDKGLGKSNPIFCEYYPICPPGVFKRAVVGYGRGKVLAPFHFFGLLLVNLKRTP